MTRGGLCGTEEQKRLKLEMKALILHVCAAFCLCLAGGCGTLTTLGQNPQHPPQARRYVYSGVRCDATAICRQGAIPTRPLARLLFVVDLPLSACADTLCLPYTIPMALLNQSAIAQAPKRITEVPDEFKEAAQEAFDSGKSFFIWTPTNQPVFGRSSRNYSSANVPVKWAVKNIDPESFDKTIFKLRLAVTAVDESGAKVNYEVTFGPLHIWDAADSFHVPVGSGRSKLVKATATISLISSDGFSLEPISNILEVQVEFKDQ